MSQTLAQGFQQSALEKRELCFKVQIITHTTQGSIKTFSDVPEVIIYHEDDTRTVTAIDSDIGFALTDLDNDAPPAVLGCLIQVGDADQLLGVELVTNSIKSVGMTAPMTALGTVTYEGGAAASGLVTKNGTSGDPSGVTSNGNIAFTFEATSLNIDEDAATTINNECMLRVTYLART